MLVPTHVRRVPMSIHRLKLDPEEGLPSIFRCNILLIRLFESTYQAGMLQRCKKSMPVHAYCSLSLLRVLAAGADDGKRRTWQLL